MKTIGMHRLILAALIGWSAGSALPRHSSVTYYHGGGCESYTSYTLRATQRGDSAVVEIAASDRTGPFVSRIPADVYALVWDSLLRIGFFDSLLPSYDAPRAGTGAYSGYIAMEYDSGGVARAKRVGFHNEPTSPPEFVTAQRLASSFDPWARTTIEQFRHGDFLKALEALGRTAEDWLGSTKKSPQCDYLERTGKAPEIIRLIFDYIGRDMGPEPGPMHAGNRVLTYFAPRSPAGNRSSGAREHELTRGKRGVVAVSHRR